MEHEKQRPYTPEEVRTINMAIAQHQLKVSPIDGKIKPDPIRCPICYKEVMILPVNVNTPRDPKTGQPVYPTQVLRTSSLNRCPRCHGGKLEDPDQMKDQGPKIPRLKT